MTALLLIGPPGSGKSAIARELGERGWVSADVDAVVARSRGMSVRDFYVLVDETTRNEAIRSAIHEFFDDIAADPDQRWALAIPSEGLGTSLDDDFADIRARIGELPGAIPVRITADLSTLVTRNGLIGPRSAAMIMPRKEFRLMAEARSVVYEAVAPLAVDTTGLSPAESADAVEAAAGKKHAD